VQLKCYVTIIWSITKFNTQKFLVISQTGECPYPCNYKLMRKKSFQISEKDTKAPLKKFEGVYINFTLHVCCFVTNWTKLIFMSKLLLYSIAYLNIHFSELKMLFLCILLIFQGVIEDRIGFFPASFAHQVRAGDRVFRCHRTSIGCKEQGQITLKEGQVSTFKQLL